MYLPPSFDGTTSYNRDFTKHGVSRAPPVKPEGDHVQFSQDQTGYYNTTNVSLFQFLFVCVCVLKYRLNSRLFFPLQNDAYQRWASTPRVRKKYPKKKHKFSLLPLLITTFLFPYCLVLKGGHLPRRAPPATHARHLLLR